MNPKFKIIKKAHMWIIIGIVLMLGSWVMFFFNAQFSEEFTWWVSIGIGKSVDSQALKASVVEYLGTQGIPNAKVSTEQSDITRLKINSRFESDQKVAELSKNIQQHLLDKKFIDNASEIVEQSIIWPSVWSYMQSAALKAVIVGLVFMVIYMLISFAAIRKYVSPTILAVITVGTMIFDISIPAGAYGLWMMIDPTIQIDSIFVIALLTCMGYSINDTIIIFDRIRENLQQKGDVKGVSYGKVFEGALWQTMRRSIGTAMSTFLVILAMYFFGTGVIKTFAFTIGIGVLAGSYSSIFISAPVAYLMLGRRKAEQKDL